MIDIKLNDTFKVDGQPVKVIALPNEHGMIRVEFTDPAWVKRNPKTDYFPIEDLVPHYPQAEKIREVHQHSQTIGEFLEWAGGQGINLMVWRTFRDPKPCDCNWNAGHEGQRLSSRENKWITCHKCDGSALLPDEFVEREAWAHAGRTINELLAEFFGVDLKAKDREDDRVLAMVRQEATTP